MLRKVMVRLNKLAGNHYSAEERDLFNPALNLVTKSEWMEIRQGFDELGYPDFMAIPTAMPIPVETGMTVREDGAISLGAGALTPEQIEAVLNTLPVDITFVDAADRVRYFNQVPDRLFPRAKGVIGRQVRRCHPRKSLHMVDSILKDFKSGAKDQAEFWIRIKNRFVHIRYFAVRGRGGEYMGTLEVTQDVTGIRALSGEKRLLD